MQPLAPNTSSSPPRRVVPRKSKMLTRLVAKPPSTSTLGQEASASGADAKPAKSRIVPIDDARNRTAPPSAFDAERVQPNGPPRELKRKVSNRISSASRLGGLGDLVRHASRNLLRDVTNTPRQRPTSELFDTSRFVDVGVKDVEPVDGDMSVEVQGQSPPQASVKPRSEAEKTALEGNDPDIGEIMVVKRHKARTPLDLEWTQQNQESETATDREVKRSKSTGWWSNNKEKKVENVEKGDGSLKRRLNIRRPSFTKDQGNTTPAAKVEELPRTSMENKGSMVLRAMRSVRSLAHISEPEVTAQPAEVPTQSKAAPNRLPGLKDRKKPSLPFRKPGESTSSWEAGALSSPERERGPSVLVPSTTRRRVPDRRVTVAAESHGDNAATGPHTHTMRPQHPRHASTPMEYQETAPPVTRRGTIAHNRLSILSVISTDEMSGAESSSVLEKQNRRSSTGSSIRWDADAMSQLAKKVREERRELKEQRRRERMQASGANQQAEEKKDKSLARRRTPLSEIFDLDSCNEEGRPVDSTAGFSNGYVDPILAATHALIGHTPSRQTPAINVAKADSTIGPLHDANAELQNLIGTMDLSLGSEANSIAPSEPVIHRTRISSNQDKRRASLPLKAESHTPAPLPSRRASESGLVTQQAAAWPPADPTQHSTSSSQVETQLQLPAIRERKRTSSSTNSVPPSAFARSSSLQSGDADAVTSLTIKKLRASRGHVREKAIYYGELDRRASVEMSLRDRTLSYQEGGKEPIVPSNRVRPVSMSGTDARKERESLRPPVDITTDIPDELRDILSRRSPSPVPVMDADSKESHVPDIPTGSLLPTPTSDQSSQVFVYTGVDAQDPVEATKEEASTSDVKSADYSLCQDFSSYDEVCKADIAPAKAATPKTSPRKANHEDVFVVEVPRKETAQHRPQESIATVESVDSYCVLSKRPAPETAPLVLHGRHQSIESTGQSIDDTFSFVPGQLSGQPKSLAGPPRHGHRRTRLVVSVETTALDGESHRDRHRTSSTGRTESGDRSFKSTLPDIAASPTSTDRGTDNGSESLSFSGVALKSSDSLFNPNEREKASKGNLFGHRKAASLVSNYSDAGLLSEDDSRLGAQSFEGDSTFPSLLEHFSPIEQIKSKRTVARRGALPDFNPPNEDDMPSSPTIIDLDVVEKLLNEEIKSASRSSLQPRSRTLGHRRGKTMLSRPLTIAVDSIQETQEDLPGLYHSPPRSRGSSSTSGRGSTQPELVDNVMIAGGEPETAMVLRRYYTFQREAQQILDQSLSMWQDTPFSADELSEFKPPTEPDDMKSFLENSRKFYFGLPSELRARRRALAAPYPAPSSPTRLTPPGTPTVDETFKDLSSWDHRRVRKVSEGKIRTRKVSEERVRSRKNSEAKARVRKVSEKRAGAPSLDVPPPVPSLNSKTFTPFLDSHTSEEGLKVGSAPLTTSVNSLRRTKVSMKLVQKQDAPQLQPINTTSKENVLRSKHSIEGMLESPTGSLRISRPRPRRRGTTTSPPSTIRL